MKTLDYLAPGPNTGGWKDRHTRAVRQALAGTSYAVHVGSAYALVRGIHAWLQYAAAHEIRFNSAIGQDHVLGAAWKQWGRALRTLLNGEIGDLDFGTLDSIILDNLVEQGFGEELL